MNAGHKDHGPEEVQWQPKEATVPADSLLSICCTGRGSPLIWGTSALSGVFFAHLTYLRLVSFWGCALQPV